MFALRSAMRVSRPVSTRVLSTAAPKKHATLVLLRHGQSQWNLENLFTGWADVPLTVQGQGEAKEAGRLIGQENILFHVAHTSVLKRAIKTLWIALEEMDTMWLPVKRSWRLNERHYGALQGLDKAETAEKYGAEQVMEWRRSYATPPPPVDKSSEHYPGNDVRYHNLTEAEIPCTESLKLTGERYLPEFLSTVVPDLKAGKNVLITAHGNSLRALVKHLDNISEEDILKLNIPTGVPLLYEFDADMNVIRSAAATAPLQGRYLGDADAVAARAAAVANQAKAK